MPMGGSSPQVRGTSCSPHLASLLCRFIPADAGNMLDYLPNYKPATVHPRRCGEHVLFAPGLSVGGGSSPQVRGTYHHSHRGRRRGRFIPAGAGNMADLPASGISLMVHPRRCGEHVKHTASIYEVVGSSPQVRGTFVETPMVFAKTRFIPAGAGNIELVNAFGAVGSVHPRRCGEHIIIAFNPSDCAGSSPQVRGTYSHNHGNNAIDRFIPAGAGNIR